MGYKTIFVALYRKNMNYKKFHEPLNGICYLIHLINIRANNTKKQKV